MPNRLLRPLLIVEFLIALQVFYTTWSEVGGQYHLELMFWPWKLGLALTGAGLITAITSNLITHDGEITRRALFLGSLLLVTIGTAGIVTFYYHLNEPTDQQEEQEDEPAKARNIAFPRPGLFHGSQRRAGGTAHSHDPLLLRLPGPAGVAAANHR